MSDPLEGSSTTPLLAVVGDGASTTDPFGCQGMSSELGREGGGGGQPQGLGEVRVVGCPGFVGEVDLG